MNPSVEFTRDLACSVLYCYRIQIVDLTASVDVTSSLLILIIIVVLEITFVHIVIIRDVAIMAKKRHNSELHTKRKSLKASKREGVIIKNNQPRRAMSRN